MKIRNKRGKEFEIPADYHDYIMHCMESGNDKAINSFVRKMQHGKLPPADSLFNALRGKNIDPRFLQPGIPGNQIDSSFQVPLGRGQIDPGFQAPGFPPVNYDGYNPDSPNRHNPFNIIPGDTISMEKVKQPLMGMPIDGNGNVGQPMLMKPGGMKKFPGAKAVLEVPTRQFGSVNPYEDPTMRPDWGYMQPDLPYGMPDPRTFQASPSIIQDPASMPPSPVPGLEPNPPADYNPFPVGQQTYQGPSLDELIAKYNDYIDKANQYNEQAYPKSLEEYAALSKKLKGYAEGQFASSVLGTLLQNPYTQAAYLDQGFADAKRKASRMPQYLLDTQRAHAEAQMSDMANRLIMNGAKPTEVASLMAPYYGRMVDAGNQLAVQRFQANAQADADYYSFLTEIGHKNTLSKVENDNNIIQAQNKQVQNIADAGTDRFRNLADLAAQEVYLRRSAEKQYTDNMFQAALMRLGIAGPELEYRMRERELQQRDQQMKDVMDLFKGQKLDPNSLEVGTYGKVKVGGAANSQVPGMGGGRSDWTDSPGPYAGNYVQPYYEVPDNPGAFRSYPEDDPANQITPRGGGRGPTTLPKPPGARKPTMQINPFEWPQQVAPNPPIQQEWDRPGMNHYTRTEEWFKKNTNHITDKKIAEEAGKTYVRKNKQKSPMNRYQSEVDKDIARGDLVYDEAIDRYVRIVVRDDKGRVIWDARNPNHPSIDDIQLWGQTVSENRRANADAKRKK